MLMLDDVPSMHRITNGSYAPTVYRVPVLLVFMVRYRYYRLLEYYTVPVLYRYR